MNWFYPPGLLVREGNVSFSYQYFLLKVLVLGGGGEGSFFESIHYKGIKGLGVLPWELEK